MKHTPGPWRVDIYRYDRQWRVYEDHPNSGAPIVNAFFHFGEEQEANAHVIAVAPDMMDVLKRAYHVFEGDTDRKRDLLNTIGEIIAKAEGQAQKEGRPDVS